MLCGCIACIYIFFATGTDPSCLDYRSKERSETPRDSDQPGKGVLKDPSHFLAFLFDSFQFEVMSPKDML